MSVLEPGKLYKAKKNCFVYSQINKFDNGRTISVFGPGTILLFLEKKQFVNIHRNPQVTSVYFLGPDGNIYYDEHLPSDHVRYSDKFEKFKGTNK